MSNWPEAEHVIDEVKKGLVSGVPPLNPKTFRVVASNGKVKIYLDGPGDTIIGDQEVCHAAGVLVLRKEGGYPTDERDIGAVKVLDVTREDFAKYKDSPYEDVVENDKTYYYEAYSYSDHGVYNRSGWCRGQASPNTNAKVTVTFTAPEVAMHTLTAKKGGKSVQATISLGLVAYLELDETGEWNVGGKTLTVNEMGENVSIRSEYYYGYDLVLSEPDPDKRTSYPVGVDNAGYASAYMDFSGGKFNYGGWVMKPGEKFMPKPVMLSYEGVVMEELDPDNYTKKIDGEPSSAASIAFEGNAMMQWGKIFTFREETEGIYKFRCCDIGLDGFDCWCNYDQDDNQIDHFYTPIYFGSSDGTRLRSISGVGNFAKALAEVDIKMAKCNGDGWYIEVLSDRLLIQDLLVLMAKSTDTSKKYGTGYLTYSGSTTPIITGTMNDKGLFWGSGKTFGVKVFGMENWWGNIWRRTAGWVFDQSIHKIKLTRGTHDGSSVSDYNLDGNGYINLTNHTISGNSFGYINEMIVEQYGRLPVKNSGSNTIYEADFFCYDSTLASCYAVCGGAWPDPDGSEMRFGAFGVTVMGETSSYVSIVCGSALSFKPRKEAA